MRVFKFGGASVKDPEAVRNVANILSDYKDESLVVVVSAMGKTTNALEKVIHAHVQQTGKAFELLNEIKEKHYQIIDELFEETNSIKASVNDVFVEAEWVLEEEVHPDYDYTYDQIVCIGELVSTKIVAAYLNKEKLPTQWLDARDIILTDNIHRAGGVQWEETLHNAQTKAKPMLEKGGFVLTQGFIGTTSENFTTTLGREGSDYTAAIFSYCLDAEDMTIWKDVPGVLTADPRKFDYVTKLDKLSYKEAIEMTYYGAKVIHPKTIKPLQNKNIPLYVKSFIDPEGSGTFISTEVEDNYPPMVAIEENQALLNISTKDFSFVAEHHMSYLFQKIADTRLAVQMMQNTAISFAICVTNVDGKVEKFINSISDEFNVDVDNNLELITVRHYQKNILDSLREGKIILLEERIRKTVQMVVKDVPMMKRKSRVEN